MISHLLKTASTQLKSTSDSPLLDAEILLAHELNMDRDKLFLIGEKQLTSQQITAYKNALTRRMKGEPIAYIVGQRAFWTLDLHVTNDVLIPRPETELLVEIALQKIAPYETKHIADLGTGSGAIALAIAHERPQCKIIAVDRSQAALAIAQKNAEKYNLQNIEFVEGNWLDPYSWHSLNFMDHHLKKDRHHNDVRNEPLFDFIISNPPYIAETDCHLENLSYEPKQALVSGREGLDDLRMIIEKACYFLKKDGTLLLEHGYNQASAVRTLLHQNHYTNIETYKDLSGNDRVTLATQNMTTVTQDNDNLLINKDFGIDGNLVLE